MIEGSEEVGRESGGELEFFVDEFIGLYFWFNCKWSNFFLMILFYI